MSLNYEQTRLVRSTVPIIREDGERISTLFYTNMIRDHPGMHAYFNPVSMQRGHQPRAFTKMMLAFASSIHDISELVARMEKVSQKHASLAITPDLYDIVGDYLLRAFGEVLGPEYWTRAVREAWERAYAVMAGMLTRREVLIYRDFGGWVGWRRFVISRRWTESGGEGTDLVTFEVRPEDRKRLPRFQPGQYVSLRVSAVPGREHPQLRQYYLCGDPAESASTYRFTVKRDSSREAEDYSQPRHNRNCSSDRVPPAPLPSMAAMAPWPPAGARGPCGSPAPSTGSSTSSRPASPSTANTSLKLGATSNPRGIRPGTVSSMLIDDVGEGDILELTHPAGEFTLDTATPGNPASSPVVLISAGVGAAPLLSMLKTLLGPSSSSPAASVRDRQQNPLQSNQPYPSSSTAGPPSSTTFSQSGTPSTTDTRPTPPSQPNRPISWVHGSRHQSPLYGDQVRELARQQQQQRGEGGLSTAFFRTRLADSELLSYTVDFQSDLNLGRVRPVEDLHLLPGRASQAEYYVCGPHRFLTEVGKYLEKNGVRPERIRFGMLSIGGMEKKD
ncbi:nitric oxide dioxygenase [Microdochium nivale]|nr:nitric oxide dioxygenase [Microdochium nivale]